jgi:methyl-accepting chemotaxis protein
MARLIPDESDDPSLRSKQIHVRPPPYILPRVLINQPFDDYFTNPEKSSFVQSSSFSLHYCMKISSRVKLWQSVVLVIVVGVVPMVAITLGVITISINKDINFGRWEAYGLEYQRPLEAILDGLPRHRYACLENKQQEVKAEEGRIERAFGELDAAQKRIGEKLQFTKDGLASRGREAADNLMLRREWDALRSSGGQADAAAYDALVDHVRMAIAHLGDTSNLILDPDLDSYYLMDMTLCALPQTQQRVGAIIMQVQDWLSHEETSAHLPEIAAMAALYGESDIARLDGDLKTALNEDIRFYGESPSLQTKLPAAFGKYLDANKALLAMLQDMAKGGNPNDAADFAAAGWKARDESYALWVSTADELDALLDTRISAYSHKRLISLLCILGALAISSAVTWFFIRRLQKLLLQLASKLRNNARQLVDISNQVSASSKMLADSASEQATSIEETSASLEELASMSKGNVDNAQEVTSLVAEMKVATSSGEREMGGLSAAMTSLQSSSKDIANIVRTIDEIAFQTNILALNAAVEAARAGETGAGFSVVADEVRSLAQRSAKAAKETSAQIESAIHHAQSGAEISTRVSSMLGNIATQVHIIDESADRVARASTEQNMGVQQINSAIVQIDDSTQKNASSAEESAAAAAELENQARSLEESVESLAAII